ncbi:uncharacterized protein LOC106669074 [Cimex lectularius]|uniref:CPR type cuticle protein n=1 Tax=Cimex lectularius TaxID=79782 RepID=A0A8I6S1B7_CIMLE|nr:uncharacterized protein LOC106669074 [Cimex lectularius]
MGRRLTWLVVAVVTVGLVGAGRVPQVPSGRRTQYLFLLDDGGYKYGYDTGLGSSEKALATHENEVKGAYSYNSPSGPVTVEYTSGVGGFKPNKLVVPPASADGYARKTFGQSSTAYGVSNQYLSPVSVSPYNQGFATATPSGYSAGHVASSHSAANGGSSDGSYSFSYNAGDHNRQESADANGNVVGRFSFVAKDDNALRTVNYKAGAESGFVATGSHLPSAGVNTPSVYNQLPTSFSDSVVVNAATSYSGDKGANDGSYSFSYNAGDHNRHESADANGNVVGSFSFVAKDDNALRTVNYKAGAESGFLATGSHLPSAGASRPSVYNQFPTSVSDSVTVNAATPNSVGGGASDGSYSFSYNAGDHSRQESADANGNVVGSFSFVPKDDNAFRTVNYKAGSESGFVASGAHLPADPTAVLQNYQTVQPLPSYQRQNVNTHSSGFAGHSFDNAENQGKTDGSYSFSYNAGDHSRQETADSAGNVVGSFSFVPKDDGVPRKVDYVAGAEQGFVARGGHLPKQPSLGSSVSSQSVLQKQTPDYLFSYNGKDYNSRGYSPAGSTYTSGGFASEGSLDPLAGTGDASYSFSYNTVDQSRQESSDPQGNVVGTFSYVGKDGLSKTVNYEAGAAKGFVAKGSHLPEHSAPSAEASFKTDLSGFNQYGSVTAQPYHLGTHSFQHFPGAKSSLLEYSLGNLKVKEFLKPNAHRKVGYVFDS